MDFMFDEMMSIVVACVLVDVIVCFVGIGCSSEGVNLVRCTHNLGFVFVYEAGVIGVKPAWLLFLIGDGIFVEIADVVVMVLEVFNYWVQFGWIDVGFFGVV